MNVIKLKVTGFDEETNSLLISFASDDTKYDDPEKYASFAYQPHFMFPDIQDLNEVVKRIAYVGMNIVENIKNEEAIKADTQKIESMKNLVGQSFEFQVAEVANIFSPPDGAVPQENLDDQFKQKVLSILAEEGLV